MSLSAYQTPGQSPTDKPAPEQMSPATRRLHDAVDAATRQAGVAYLHPEGPTVTVDLFGSDTMLAWQQDKTQRVMLSAAPWAAMPPIYGRYGTSEGRRLIDAVCALEAAEGAVLTDSGMQAVSLTFDALLAPKSHALVSRQVYNKSKAYLTWLSERLELHLGILDAVTPQSLEEKVQPDSVLVFAETFTNPLLRALDPPAVGRAVAALREQRAAALHFVVDNTIATPWGMKSPVLATEGIDVVVASGTKALGGQDRDMWGYVASRDVALLNHIMDLQAMRGGGLSWRVAAAVTPRLEDAAREHQQRCQAACRVAAFLQQHPAVADVTHPSLSTHPDHAIVAQHYTRSGSLVAFRLAGADEEQTRHFCDVLATTRIVRYALSFDGWVTKVNHHKSVSEFHTPDGVLRKQGIDRMVRLAVGLEDPDDIVACVNWALCHYRTVSAEQVARWQAQRRRELNISNG